MDAESIFGLKFIDITSKPWSEKSSAFGYIPKIGEYMNLKMPEYPKAFHKIVAIVHMPEAEHIEVYVKRISAIPELYSC